YKPTLHLHTTPEPGDLIEISRGLYQHWAVYVGNGDVVHVTLPPGAANRIKSVPTKKATVKKEKMKEVVGDSTWKINNSLDEKYEPRSARIIVKEALGKVDKRMEYSVIRENCEHFATKMRYGKAVSIQVSGPISCVAVVKTKKG
uniref:LRAT domain-containing protein n=1 Tax=Sparus aurata TaxID=8175 RepID=A0A671WT81_SPAAU